MRRPSEGQRRAIHVQQKYRIGKNRYRVLGRDENALVRLQHLRQCVPRRPNPYWLLAHRRVIREIVLAKPRAILTHVVLDAPDDQTRMLALWLRGLCGGALGANELLQLAKVSSARVQRLTARALYRMGAWAQLRELEGIACRGDASGRQFAQRQPPKFSSRLDRFVSHLPQLDVQRTTPRLFMADINPRAPGNRGKPRWLIRLVLDRIRMLVSAEHSVDRLPKEYLDDPS